MGLEARMTGIETRCLAETALGVAAPREPSEKGCGVGDYILVVDDDPDVRNLILEVLRLLGFEARKAVDGQQALQIVEEHPPQAIVLDLMMPTLNGFLTLTRQQRDRKSQPIPIILLSGLAETNCSMHKLPGVVGVMRKGDFSVEGLRTLLSRAGIKAR